MRLHTTWLEADVRYMVAHADVEPERSHYACILHSLLKRMDLHLGNRDLVLEAM